MKVGILGGGQLGRMLAIAAHRLGITPVIYAPDPGPASAVAAESRLFPFDDIEALERFAAEVDVCTFEVEHVPLAAVEILAAKVPFHPNPNALIPTRDRLLEKQLLNGAGIPTAPYLDMSEPDAVERLEAEVGFPCLLKTRVGGYDGKGQAKVNSTDEARAALAELGVPCIAEGWVPWERELSVVAVRSHDGEVRYYDMPENTHIDGILRYSTVPAPGLPEAHNKRLQGHVARLMKSMDYVGVMSIEWFQTGDLYIANEIAPRVHNSGHWTQDGAVTCQFESHIRAICGLPLGDTRLVGPNAMINLIGTLPEQRALLQSPAIAHLYGKSERPGRKLGHVNVLGRDTTERDAALAEVLQLARDAWE